VADLWTGDEVSGDTLTGVYSSTKGAATLVTALLVQEGVLDLDEPVVRRWPEFAAAGKDTITLRDVLTHRSGVIGVDGGLSAAELADDAVIARRLAAQRPYWRPGSAYGYGGFVTFAMAGEVIRRVTGQSLQQVYDERVRVPYGLDLYLGLPEAEEQRSGRSSGGRPRRSRRPRSGRTFPARTGFYLAAILTAVLLLRPRPANRDAERTPETSGSTPG
jgi:CubicO group peptidase (beta-lactamase class C family)